MWKNKLDWKGLSSFLKEGNHEVVEDFLKNIDCMIFYYNSNNKKFAANNRNQYHMVKPEWIVRNLVLKKDKTWYRFLRQKPIWNYIIDFYCDKLKLWIEIDDKSHDFKWKDDDERTKYLNNLWIKIIRYTNEQVHFNLDWLITDLNDKIERRATELWI